MRMPSLDPTDPAQVDIEQVCKMVDIFMERGFTYFDTAIMYNNFASESTAKKVLVDRYPRDSFTLATKLHSGFIESLEDRDKIFNSQLEKTGAGYFDYYLLHGIEASMLPKYEELDCFNWLLDKKEKGLVKHIGFSFHDTPELLDEILTKHPEMEFVQLQINYLDWESQWIQSRAVYEMAEKHGKPVIVMEPVKGGTLANVPVEAAKLFSDYEEANGLSHSSAPSWAIRFAASLPNVMVVLSGMSSVEQMEDNTSFMSEFNPLSEKEKEVCFKVADVINSQIAIPDYFSLYNEDMREDLKKKGWTISFSTYNNLTKKFGKASDCVQCGQCEQVCPQHLSIIDHLMLVACHFENHPQD